MSEGIGGDRAIRIEILEGGQIEIRRTSYSGKVREPVYYDDEEAALIVIEMLFRAARERGLKERFEPQIVKEGWKEFERLKQEAEWQTKPK
jgi:hypothetical protein